MENKIYSLIKSAMPNIRMMELGQMATAEMKSYCEKLSNDISMLSGCTVFPTAPTSQYQAFCQINTLSLLCDHCSELAKIANHSCSIQNYDNAILRLCIEIALFHETLCNQYILRFKSLSEVDKAEYYKSNGIEGEDQTKQNVDTRYKDLFDALLGRIDLVKEVLECDSYISLQTWCKAHKHLLYHQPNFHIQRLYDELEKFGIPEKCGNVKDRTFRSWIEN